jgi:arylsulfatase A-like enzyme
MAQTDTRRRQPNVVLVITDDQGYGDLGCHGNEVIRTPHIDRLHADSVRLTNFHVGPTCAPTRAGLMTGRYCNCTGVWHTIMGRSLLRADEVTLADVFAAGGYRTGMFGKWHLGDNYPFRPHDRGFQEAFYHGGGGVSQTPDYWGNSYFDDTYFDRGRPVPTEGYCTDVWFARAGSFIEAHRDRPFFCYLPTNAPHGPYNVADKYADPYRATEPDRRARFWGMITCIDENVGRLRAKLDELGLTDNTILIWMTDNGSSGGCDLDADQFVIDGYNAGMRGKKGSAYDGGHRVPFFVHWPAGGMTRGVDVDRLTANIDVLPTLTDLCGLDAPGGNPIDGVSLAPLLRGESGDWPERVIVTDSQRIEQPVKWKDSATMTDRWRLVNGRELYDVGADPEQRRDLAAEHPDVVAELRDHYEAWWDLVSPTLDRETPIVVGSADEPVSTITGHDWHGERCPWNQGLIREGEQSNGYWVIEIAHPGRYAFELRRWPRELDKPITEGIEGEITDWYTGGRAMPLETAKTQVADRQQEAEIPPGAKFVTFELDLPAGVTRLQTWLTGNADLTVGAYYVYAWRLR